MNENQFWQIIQTAKRAASNIDQQLELIEAALHALELDDILEFQRIFEGLHERSYRADLWGAAHIINGGATSDGFDYFRGWLIAQGREVFTAALEQPDSLDALFKGETDADFLGEFEEMLTVAREVWMEKTGLDDEDMDEAVGTSFYAKQIDLSAWCDEDGHADDVKCKAVYPRLWARFGG